MDPLDLPIRRRGESPWSLRIAEDRDETQAFKVVAPKPCGGLPEALPQPTSRMAASVARSYVGGTWRAARTISHARLAGRG